MKAFAGTLIRRAVLLAVLATTASLGAAPAHAADGHKVVKDVAYLDGADLSDYENERCKLDLYLPNGATNAPVLVWFHGGGLRGGEKDGAVAVGVAERFAGERIIVASVNYRLSPKAEYPAYVEDAARAVAWVLRNIAAHGGDPDRVFVSGHSAGGYLAAMVGCDGRWLEAAGESTGALAGLMPISGQMITHSTVRGERGIEKTTPLIDDAAPSYHARPDAPPMLCICGSEDLAARAAENIYFVEAMRAAGHEKIEYLEVEGRTHGTVANRIPEAGDIVARSMIEFMRPGVEDARELQAIVVP